MRKFRVALFLVCFSHFIQRPYRNEVLTQLNPDNITTVMSFTFVLSFIIIALIRVVEKRTSAGSIAVALLLTSLVLHTALFHGFSRPAAPLLYLIVGGSFNLTGISVIWLLAMTRITHQNYSSSFQLGMSTQWAALAGSIGSIFISAYSTPSSALFIGILALFTSLLTIVRVDSDRTDESLGSLSILSKSSFSTYVLIYTIISTGLYYFVLKKASEEILVSSLRLDIYSYLDLTIHVFTLLLSFIVARFTLHRNTGFILPPVLAALCLVWIHEDATVITCLIVLIIFKCSHYAITRPHRELYLAQQSNSGAISAKVFSDSVTYRLGDAIGAWFISFFISFGMDIGAMALYFLPFTVLWLVAGLFLIRP